MAKRKSETQEDYERRLELERDLLQQSVASNKLDRLQEQVAWILNHYPETRDSDPIMYERFWQTFQDDLCEGDYIRLRNLLKLTRPTSLSRERAKIQNDYKLFVATADVRRRRKQLSEEERERHLEQRPVFPMYAVYVDEAGKTESQVVVGGLWNLHAAEALHLQREVAQLLEAHGFVGELHFRDITATTLPVYMAVADLVFEKSAALRVCK